MNRIYVVLTQKSIFQLKKMQQSSRNKKIEVFSRNLTGLLLSLLEDSSRKPSIVYYTSRFTFKSFITFSVSIISSRELVMYQYVIWKQLPVTARRFDYSVSIIIGKRNNQVVGLAPGALS